MSVLTQLAERFNPRPELSIEELGISPQTFIRRGARVALTQRDRLLTARLGDGTIVRGRNRPGYGGRAVYMFREAVEPELGLMRSLLQPGDAAIDIGSCVGTYTMSAAAEVGPQGSVIAVDPDPAAIAILQRTAELNGFNNVAAICTAASDVNGLTQFSVEEERPDTRHMTGDAFEPGSLHRVVPTRTIDSIAHDLGLARHIRFIKIDAEGAEAKVLAGAEQTIETSHPVIVLETEISDVPSLADYEIFEADNSRNHVLVHRGDDQARPIVAAHFGLADGDQQHHHSTR